MTNSGAWSELIRLASKIVRCPSRHDPGAFCEQLPKTTPVTARRMITDALYEIDVERKNLAVELGRIAEKLREKDDDEKSD